MSDAACACLKVSYDPIKHDDGSFSERWVCSSCGAEFVRRPMMQTIVFAPQLFEDIKNEKKTVTIRKGIRDYVVGPAIAEHRDTKETVGIMIERLTFIPFQNISSRQLASDFGTSDVDQCLLAMQEYYPDLTRETVMTVVDFTLDK
jgi:hypothetical protein